jgi:PE-PPE domain
MCLGFGKELAERSLSAMSQASTGARPGKETTMGYGRCVGRVGALAVAIRMTVSIGVAAVVVMATAVPAPDSTVSPAVRLSADSTALIMGTSGVPTPDDFYVESVKNQFIAPTHPGQIGYVKVTTPEGLWPVAGLGRLVSLLGLGLGAPEIVGPGGPGWDVPWWNLTGLFDLTLDQSVQAGVADLERAIAAHPNDHLVIYGYSQSALIANREKQRLAEQHPKEPTPPTSTSCWAVTRICPTGAFLPGSRASTSRSSTGRSTAPRRPTPSSTRWKSTTSTTSWAISPCIRSTSSPT